jgi:hypothetical protein
MALPSQAFSYENLILLRDEWYIITESLVSWAMKNVFYSASRTVDRADNDIRYKNEPIFCQPLRFRMDDLDLEGKR